MLRDFRHGFRALRRRPLYALLVVCVLALGIGANVAVYTIVDGVFLSSLPYAEADRLVTLWSTSPRGETRLSVSYPDFRDWNESTESVESMDLVFGHLVVLEERNGPSQVVAAAVTPGFFTTLGAGMERRRGIAARRRPQVLDLGAEVRGRPRCGRVGRVPERDFVHRDGRGAKGRGLSLLGGDVDTAHPRDLHRAR